MKKRIKMKCEFCGKKTEKTNVCDECFFPKTRKDYHKFLYGTKK